MFFCIFYKNFNSHFANFNSFSYLCSMKKKITVIGGANVDLSATLSDAFIAADSNPGKVQIGFGGVARNIAHNLALLGHEVQLMTMFGGDEFGKLLAGSCREAGIDIALSERAEDRRSGTYLCINEAGGEMIAAVADTDVVGLITPDWLAERLEAINGSEIVVVDTNISVEALQYLYTHVRVPMYIDGVSTTKAKRMVQALREVEELKCVLAVKLNLSEALVITGETNYTAAARRLLDMGVAEVYITMGEKGIYGRGEEEKVLLPALPIEHIVNTTGAGDAFLAGVVHAKMLGKDMAKAAETGLLAARAALLSSEAVNKEIAQIIHE